MPDVKSATPIPTAVVGNLAPAGWRWRCGACGKTTKDRFGHERGWDASCMLNSFLVKTFDEGLVQP